jgi:uracil-DNA glycosylase
MITEDCWVYDGSLEALLILVARSMTEGRTPLRVRMEGKTEASLFDGDISTCATCADGALAEEAAARIRATSSRLYAAVLKAWMAEEGVEADLLDVALDCAGRGDLALADYSRPALSRLAASVRRVTREMDRLQGFARFAPLRDGRYVARLEPDHNVLPALASFFLGRFGREPFALVDLVRSYALSSLPGTEGTTLEILQGEALARFEPDGDDGEEAELWQRYFRVVENVSRRNPELQRRLMPSRYWRHLTEFGGG